MGIPHLPTTCPNPKNRSCERGRHTHRCASQAHRPVKRLFILDSSLRISIRRFFSIPNLLSLIPFVYLRFVLFDTPAFLENTPGVICPVPSPNPNVLPLTHPLGFRKRPFWVDGVGISPAAFPAIPDPCVLHREPVLLFYLLMLTGRA